MGSAIIPRGPRVEEDPKAFLALSILVASVVIISLLYIAITTIKQDKIKERNLRANHDAGLADSKDNQTPISVFVQIFYPEIKTNRELYQKQCEIADSGSVQPFCSILDRIISRLRAERSPSASRGLWQQPSNQPLSTGNSTEKVTKEKKHEGSENDSVAYQTQYSTSDTEYSEEVHSTPPS